MENDCPASHQGQLPQQRRPQTAICVWGFSGIRISVQPMLGAFWLVYDKQEHNLSLVSSVSPDPGGGAIVVAILRWWVSKPIGHWVLNLMWLI